MRAERDILATATHNPWIVELRCSFQDEEHLYLVMEFLSGGDLMTLLMDEDVFSEQLAQFFIAETVLAVDSVHKLNYIHRDLKPDNLLIGATGHLKLSDFGLCKHAEIKPARKVDPDKLREIDPQALPRNEGLSRAQASKRYEYKRIRKLAYSTVGTPDYIAPEVFGREGYTESVDWWSVGALLFEMLVGYPPFYSDEPAITCQKILQW